VLNHCAISIESKEVLKLEYLHLQITFEDEICKWRNFDYTWVDITKDRTSNDLSPKIIILKNTLKVLPSKNIGQWEVNPKKKNKIVWKLIDKSLNSRVSFDENNIKTYVSNPQLLKKKLELTLLFTKKKAPEVSRSKIPFSSIFCFTDHCDFDSELLLEKQRLFFKELDIITTKGFFLNHFSKRSFNTSFEKEKDEFDKWLKDGHELAYHSLTQSIRESKEAEKEFIKFKQPSKEIVTWIDHGFQPYNLSLCKIEKLSFFKSLYLVLSNILIKYLK
jgi:hypothetical protein